MMRRHALSSHVEGTPAALCTEALAEAKVWQHQKQQRLGEGGGGQEYPDEFMRCLSHVSLSEHLSLVAQADVTSAVAGRSCEP